MQPDSPAAKLFRMDKKYQFKLRSVRLQPLFALALVGVALLCCGLASTHISFEPRLLLFDPNDAVHLTHDISCGDACKYDAALSAPSKDQVAPLRIQCPSIFIRMLGACPATAWPPPEEIPAELMAEFTMDGAIAVKKYYFNNTRYSGFNKARQWVKADIDAVVRAPTLFPAAKSFITYGTSDATYVDSAVRRYSHAVHGKVGIVWGSESPWVEIILLRAGAKHVVTIEYSTVQSHHHALTPTTPQRFAAFMLSQNRQFDFAATFSSLEHSGLGRYGDSVDPYGDLHAMAQTWCALRPGGYFFLGLPSADPQAVQDELHWNAHRFYGRKRLAQIFRGYEYITTIPIEDTGASYTTSLIHILRKPSE